MEQVTLGETHRLLLDHIKENKEYHATNAIFLKGMDEKINTILISTTELGGRVKNLEDSKKNVDETLEEHDESIKTLTGYQKWLMGGVGVLMVFGGFFFKILWQNLEYRIDQKLNNKFVDYENNKN